LTNLKRSLPDVHSLSTRKWKDIKLGPYRLDDSALVVVGTRTIEDAEAAGNWLRDTDRRAPWFIGDWFNHTRRRLPEDMVAGRRVEWSSRFVVVPVSRLRLLFA